MNRRWRIRRRHPNAPRAGIGLLLSVVLALAVGRAANAAVQEDEASYIDPGFGWSIAWDPELWLMAGSAETTTNEEGVAGNEVVIAGIDQLGLGAVFVGSHTDFGGDLGTCLETVETDILMMGEISDARDADLELPRAPDDAVRTLSFARISGGGLGYDGVIYVECRPLVADEAVLSIRWLLPDSNAYDEALPQFEDLIATIDLDGADAASGAAGDASDQADDEASGEDETGEYTDPAYGWSITWDPAIWEGQEPIPTVGEDGTQGNQLDLYGKDLGLGGATVASLPAPTFADDLAACVDYFRPLTSEELVGDGAYVENLRELDLDLPEAPPDAVRKLFQWDSGIDESQTGYYECRPLVEGEAVLLVRWVLPVGEDYEAHLPVFEDLVAGLDLSDAHPVVG